MMLRLYEPLFDQVVFAGHSVSLLSFLQFFILYDAGLLCWLAFVTYNYVVDCMYNACELDFCCSRLVTFLLLSISCIILLL